MNKTKQIAWSIILVIFFALLIIFTRSARAESPTIIYPECQNAPTEIQKYACEQVAINWDITHWGAFNSLIDRESKWDYQAKNPKSSAYGLPQALLSLHKVSADFKTNPYSQVDWAIQYMKDTYGNPKNAWKFWQVKKWY